MKKFEIYHSFVSEGAGGAFLGVVYEVESVADVVPVVEPQPFSSPEISVDDVPSGKVTLGEL